MMLRRFRTPVPVEVTLDAATGEPVHLRGPGRAYRVARVDEAWDTVAGWWAGQPAARCYYRLRAVGGAHCLVYRDLATGRWFLAGIFD